MFLAVVAVVAAVGAACSGGQSDPGDTAADAATTTITSTPPDLTPAGLRDIDGFEPWLGRDPSSTPDHDGARLCEETATFMDPETEKHDITCEFEGANFASDESVVADEIVVMTWNLERNYRLTDQIAAFRDGTLPVPDILLASEVDRGCDRSDRVNGGWELAKALSLNYVFGVEFVEGVRDDLSTPCEHGQGPSSVGIRSERRVVPSRQHRDRPLRQRRRAENRHTGRPRGRRRHR